MEEIKKIKNGTNTFLGMPVFRVGPHFFWVGLQHLPPLHGYGPTFKYLTASKEINLLN
jgi:hypothetical protein